MKKNRINKELDMGLDMGGQAFSQSRGFIFLSPGVKISFMAKCFHCKGTIEAEGRPGRGERCPWCGSDVKVCLNCRFYDTASYNECRENSAERVVHKDRANFCEFFELGERSGEGSAGDPLKKLKELFKS